MRVYWVLSQVFVMYRHNAALYGMEYVGVPLNPDFSLNPPAVLSAIEQHQPSLIFIAYPNNPTGVCFKREEVEAVIVRLPALWLSMRHMVRFIMTVSFRGRAKSKIWS